MVLVLTDAGRADRVSGGELSQKAWRAFWAGLAPALQRSLAINLALGAENPGDFDKRIGLRSKTARIATSAHAHVQHPVSRAGCR
jgi:hypothetical protein